MIYDDAHWEAQRARIFLPLDSINLNAGTLSPTPRAVMAAVEKLRHMQAAAPSDFLWRQSQPRIDRARAELAAYLNCRPIDLLLLTNVTHGVNLAVASLKLPRGSEILMTDHEYGAMVFCWRKLAAERGWTIRNVRIPYASENPADFVSAFEDAVRPESKALFFSHVLSTTGLVLPAAELCAWARRRGMVSVVDGAHGPGMVPVDLGRIDADFYAANCHKWIMAPMGAGFLCAREEHHAAIEPQVVSWGWGYPPAELYQESGVSGAKWQYALEFYGCTERCPQMVLPDVFEFRASLGGEAAIAARTRELALYAREQLAALGYKPATPLNPALSGALAAFEFPACDTIKVRDQFWFEHRIECPVNITEGRFFLRVSAAWFVTKAEIDRLAEALAKMEGTIA